MTTSTYLLVLVCFVSLTFGGNGSFFDFDVNFDNDFYTYVNNFQYRGFFTDYFLYSRFEYPFGFGALQYYGSIGFFTYDTGVFNSRFFTGVGFFDNGDSYFFPVYPGRLTYGYRSRFFDSRGDFYFYAYIPGFIQFNTNYIIGFNNGIKYFEDNFNFNFFFGDFDFLAVTSYDSTSEITSNATKVCLPLSLVFLLSLLQFM